MGTYGCAYQPPALGTCRRRRAACPQRPTYGARTSRGRSVRTACCGTPGTNVTLPGGEAWVFVRDPQHLHPFVPDARTACSKLALEAGLVASVLLLVRARVRARARVGVRARARVGVRVGVRVSVRVRARARITVRVSP